MRERRRQRSLEESAEKSAKKETRYRQQKEAAENIEENEFAWQNEEKHCKKRLPQRKVREKIIREFLGNRKRL